MDRRASPSSPCPVIMMTSMSGLFTLSRRKSSVPPTPRSRRTTRTSGNTQGGEACHGSVGPADQIAAAVGIVGEGSRSGFRQRFGSLCGPANRRPTCGSDLIGLRHLSQGVVRGRAIDPTVAPVGVSDVSLGGKCDAIQISFVIVGGLVTASIG